MENLTDHKVFGKYEILDQLAIGGMGQIYLARQHDNYGIDRLVILKSLFPEMTRDKECVKMFLDEARIASNLNHPNIVSIYEIGAWEDNYYLAMEYIRGEPLSYLMNRTIEKQEPVPISFILSIMHDTCEALGHAHKATNIAGEALHLIHRDISPQNIMLNDAGVLKVVDFGIARAANRYTKTYAGQIKGKISYMAPEQLRGEILDGRSDQYALGIVMWELIAGKPLLGKDLNASEVLDWKLNNKLMRLSGQREDIPIEIDSIIAKMTATQADKRYRNTLEIRDALKELLLPYTGVTAERIGAWVTHLAGDKISKRHEKIAARSAEFQRVTAAEEPKALQPEHITPTPSIAAPPSPTVQEPSKVSTTKYVGMVILSTLLIALITAGILHLSSPSTRKASNSAKKSTTTPHQASGYLEINSNPNGAQVVVDGKTIGTTPIRKLKVSSGVSQTLHLTLNNYQTKTLDFALKPEEERIINVSMRPLRDKTTPTKIKTLRTKPKKAAAHTQAKPQSATTTSPSKAPQTFAPSAPIMKASKNVGFLSIKSDPWTQVFIDGQDYGLTPLYKQRLTPGDHQLEMRNTEAGIVHRQKITIQSEKNLKLDLKL